MKIRLFYFLTILLMLSSCENETKEETIIAQPETETTTEKIVVEKELVEEFSFDDFKGSYVGEFDAINYDSKKKPSYSNRINISLDSINIEKEILFGHSVVAGNSRPFKGEYTYDNINQTITANLKEPGDDKYDGVFHIICFASSKILKGNWLANDKNLAVTERSYDLEKKVFKYNSEIMIDGRNLEYASLYNGTDYENENGDFETVSEEITIINASSKLLEPQAIENLYKADLEVIRNTIYARHGYSFKNRRMRYFFDEYVEWYIPVSTDVRAQLTEIEYKNIELIKRYEEHAEKYYDHFGR